MPNLVVETDLFARSIIVIVQRNNNNKKERKNKRKNKEKKNAKDDLMVKGNDIYSHFNDVLNVNEAKLCFPRKRERQHYTLLGLRLYCIGLLAEAARR